MIPLEDEDRMGFLPGDVDEKMGPWLQPIWQSLSFLKEQSNENKKLIEEMIELRKLYFAPLDYIRGTSFYKDLVIVDDAQNLTPHQVKTIITRAGNQAKIVFTGDLGQIDRKKRLDRRSSGLAYATDKLNDQSLVAVTRFKETVRSPLASLAEEYL
jgi:PhoH-like ATPase